MNNVTDRMVEAAWKAYYASRDGKSLHAAIEAALREMPAPEPVASLMTNIQSGDVEVVWNDDGFDRALWHETPLYAHPPQQRRPLTEEEIWRLDEPVADVPWKRVVTFVRWIERAHGIKEDGDASRRTAMSDTDKPVAWDWLPSDARSQWVIGPPQRKPLTEEEIYTLYSEPCSDAEMVAFARAIERAHGIGGEE